MMSVLVRQVAPYAVILVVALALLQRTVTIAAAAGGQGAIGPALWPRLILWLLIATCAYEGLRRGWVALRGAPAARIVAAPEPQQDAMETHESDPRVVALCVAATVLYVAGLETVGFFLDTIWFVATLMWAGRFRRPVALAAISFGATMFFMIVFMRVIFVSLPIGTGPFASVSTAIMRLIGVH
ncbi:MAG: hypothetical protein JWM77_495 [Rhodospirillales bacterium]|nr:hypothetical protein [Rhodospirillales bacterium]